MDSLLSRRAQPGGLSTSGTRRRPGLAEHAWTLDSSSLRTMAGASCCLLHHRPPARERTLERRRTLPWLSRSLHLGLSRGRPEATLRSPRRAGRMGRRCLLKISSALESVRHAVSLTPVLPRGIRASLQRSPAAVPLQPKDRPERTRRDSRYFRCTRGRGPILGLMERRGLSRSSSFQRSLLPSLQALQARSNGFLNRPAVTETELT
jgi:hypothetical protein